MDYKKLAESLLAEVGGEANVISVVHCATRLRFTLKDNKIPDTEKIKKMPDIMGVVLGGGQYQIVIGTDVPNVYQELLTLGSFEGGGTVEAEQEGNKNKLFSRLLESIASIFQPIIPAITGAGLLKALMALLVVFGWMDNTSQTYLIISSFADAPFYFLPILLASSAAKKFKCNTYLAMTLGGILVYPDFINMIATANADGGAIAFMGLPVTPATYASSVIPILLGVWVLSFIQKYADKYSPKAVKFFTVPLISIFIAGTLTIVVLGPLGTLIGNGIATFIKMLDAYAGWLVPLIIGTLCPLLVMTGTHYSLIPIAVNNIATTGFEATIIPGMLTSNIAQGAAALAVAVTTKDKDMKQLAGSAGLTGVLGITEPALYGVNLKLRLPLYGSMIGGGVGGLYLGILGIRSYAAGSPGLLVLPGYIGGDGLYNFIQACVGTGIAFAVSFAATWIMSSMAERKKI